MRSIHAAMFWTLAWRTRYGFVLITSECSNLHAESLSKPRSPCLVVTGQPGIGEFCACYYLCTTDISDTVSRQKSLALVVVRVASVLSPLRKKKPVIVYFNGTFWLFVDEGVFKQPDDFLSTYYQIVIWTLVDSMDTPSPQSGLPIGLITHGTQDFVLYTTSTAPSRWNKLHQSMCPIVRVMNPWNKAEIRKA